MKVGIYVRIFNEKNIIEWMDYHYKCGFDFILLYDDYSNPSVKYIIENYGTFDKYKYLVLEKLIPKVGETSYLNHKETFQKYFLPVIQKYMDYVLYIDIDEYLYMHRYYNIKELINDFGNVDQLYIRYIIFGNNNLIECDTTNILKNFTSSHNLVLDCGKSLCKTSLIDYANSPHYFVLKNNTKYMMDQFKNTININSSCPSIKTQHNKHNIYIAHFQTYDFKTYLQRRLFNGPARLLIREFEDSNKILTIKKKYTLDNIVDKIKNEQNYKNSEEFLFIFKKFLMLNSFANTIKNNDLLNFYNNSCPATTNFLISRVGSLYTKKNYLFNKYKLNLSHPTSQINYKIIKPYIKDNKLWAHLHCFDIDLFEEIYGNNIKNIINYFNVIVTFSKGQSLLDYNIILLKINNKGMDIGAKICCLKYLKDNDINFSHILFLHSKTNTEIRLKYFNPLVKNKEIIEKNIKLLHKYDAIFNNIHEGYDFTPEYISNRYYHKEILEYLNCSEKEELPYSEGNCMILSKQIIDFIFSNNLYIFYNILNTENSFDISWVIGRYGKKDNEIYELLDDYNNNAEYMNLNNNGVSVCNNFGNKSNDMPDGMVEHVFERIYINVIMHLKLKYFVAE